MATMKKEHILKELRRTAEANGGVPLGRLSFLKETGIKESDWKGKFWARWNDVVREAGLEPNQKQGAFDESFLIEKLIALMRELGRFPVVAELRMKKRSDARFPNSKVYERRFGTKTQLVAKIRDYCHGRTGSDDVVAMCSAVIDHQGLETESDAESEESIGFIYLMKSGRFYKIGRSNAAGRREYELAIQLPEKLRTVHAIRTDDPAGIEEYWHKRFAAKRKNGEWFDLDSKDIAAFRRRKFM
ncbi:MAG: GIY-YIG nuclease family protein [Candidatus Acidiferrales bacterium]